MDGWLSLTECTKEYYIEYHERMIRLLSSSCFVSASIVAKLLVDLELRIGMCYSYSNVDKGLLPKLAIRPQAAPLSAGAQLCLSRTM